MHPMHISYAKMCVVSFMQLRYSVCVIKRKQSNANRTSSNSQTHAYEA